MRFLRIVALPITLLACMFKGLWFLFAAFADMAWEEAFGGKDETHHESLDAAAAQAKFDRDFAEWMEKQK